MVLITGATGFVGRQLWRTLAAEGRPLRVALRTNSEFDGQKHGNGNAEWVIVGEIGPDTDWSEVLKGVDCVVHLAARVHVMHERASDPLAAFRRVNTEGTERLARQAAVAGVRRLVFLSSIKVNGEATRDRPFSEIDPARPEDPYGQSKSEAEQALARVASETGLEIVILRPPLVYGPGVKGNFHNLLWAVGKGIPLPLGMVQNRRSLIYLGNLVDAIVHSIGRPAAAGKTYLLSDGDDVSTPELIRRIAAALERPARLISVSPALLELAGRLVGKSGAVSRLLDSLQVDSSKIVRELGWSPPYSMEDGLRETAAWFKGAG